MTEPADFLTRMVDRTLERVPVVEPREMSRFETRRLPARHIESQDVVVEETTARSLLAHHGLHGVHEIALPREHRESAEAPAINDAEPSRARALPTEPDVRVRSPEAVPEPVPPPRQTHLHRVIHDQHPTLVPRLVMSLPPPEVAKPCGAAPDAASVGGYPSPAREHDEPARPEKLPRRAHNVAAPLPRTQSLLPKQPLVSDLIARTAGSASQPHDVSNAASDSMSDTVVHVTIGRVEVRAGAPPQKAATADRRSHAHQPMTLTEYLQKRGASR
jgi:hypothetical protein